MVVCKHETEYEISECDGSSDVCSSHLVSGEESAQQIKMRGERLGIQTENCFVYAETNREEIGRAACRERVCQYGEGCGGAGTR